MLYWRLLLLLLICSAASLKTAAEPARLAIIIDDIGYNLAQSERAARLPGQFTLAILPFTPYGNQVARLAHERGKELMLHQPMSNLKDMPLGRGALTNGMGREAVQTTVRANLASLPLARGLNNHMGSKFTQDAQAMGWVMDELAARKLYFIDSRTSPLTQAQAAAERSGIPSGKRDVFLDDVIEPAVIRHQLNRAFQLAHKQGGAIAIGHPYPATMQVLEHIQPLLEQANVHLVFASQLTRQRRTQVVPKYSTPVGACPAGPGFHWPSPPAVDFKDVTAMMNASIFGY
jgi:uncharacterized protein